MTIKEDKELVKYYWHSIGHSIGLDTHDPDLRNIKFEEGMVMTVEPGFGGQTFMQDCADKIPLIKQHSNDNLIIQVDGGINSETAIICKELGATSLVAGNYIYNSEDINTAIKNLM